MGYVELVALGEAPMHPDCFVIEEVLSHDRLPWLRRAAEELWPGDLPAYERPPDEGYVSYLDVCCDIDIAGDEQFEVVEGSEPRARSTPPPPWAIGFSKQFHKDTKALDGKLLGRVLKALEELSLSSRPLRPHGDTFKPLEGELKGCWRYRIGDHRLVVQPRVEDARIDALTLAARGSVYD